jgi:hypothetical protein
MMTATGCLIFLAGCLNNGVDDGVGLRALQPSLVALGSEVQRIDDTALTAAYRDHAATWQAALGE